MDASGPFRGRLTPLVLALLVVVQLGAGMATLVVRSGAERRTGGAAAPPAGPPSQPPAARPTEVAPGPAPPESPALPHVPPAQRGPLEELMAQVAQVRGLAWKEPLGLRLVPRDEMVRRLADANARDADPARVAAEEATLKLLGLIPASLDYRRLIDDILRTAVLGFYDPETKELYVAVRDVNALEAGEKATIVHEMTHALTDQHFAYGPRTIALDKADRGEESLALSALIEGDARLTERLWMERNLSEIDALAVVLGVGADVGDGVEVLARIPSYVRRALLFPYEAGLDFVERLRGAKDFAPVNAAYLRSPASTEHILHPEAYAAAENAASPPLPDLAAATGCRRLRAGALGEFDMGALLDQQVPGTAAAAAGWNGDAYVLLRCGTSLAMADRWEADSAPEAVRLAEALNRWAARWSGGAAPGADGRFAGPSGAGRIVRNGARVDLVVARDAATASRLAGALG